MLVPRGGHPGRVGRPIPATPEIMIEQEMEIRNHKVNNSLRILVSTLQLCVNCFVLGLQEHQHVELRLDADGNQQGLRCSNVSGLRLFLWGYTLRAAILLPFLAFERFNIRTAERELQVLRRRVVELILAMEEGSIPPPPPTGLWAGDLVEEAREDAELDAWLERRRSVELVEVGQAGGPLERASDPPPPPSAWALSPAVPLPPPAPPSPPPPPERTAGAPFPLRREVHEAPQQQGNGNQPSMLSVWIRRFVELSHVVLFVYGNATVWRADSFEGCASEVPALLWTAAAYLLATWGIYVAVFLTIVRLYIDFARTRRLQMEQSPGATQGEIRKLAVHKFVPNLGAAGGGRAGGMSMAEEDALCSICIEPYAAGEKLTELPCKHLYHQQCVSPWLEKNMTCPLCKAPIAARGQAAAAGAAGAAGGSAGAGAGGEAAGGGGGGGGGVPLPRSPRSPSRAGAAGRLPGGSSEAVGAGVGAGAEAV